MPRWRYLAADALTGALVHQDLPMTRDTLSWDLSGPGSLRGSISPEFSGLLAGGKPILNEWGTLLYAEADNTIRWGGILQRSTFEGGRWTIEAAGFTSYPKGIPWVGDTYSRVGVDPITVVRDIWDHVQSQSDGNLGMTYSLPASPVRLGIPAVPAYIEVNTGTTGSPHWVAKSSVPASTVVPKVTGALAAKLLAASGTLTLAKLGNWAALDGILPYEVTVGTERITVAARAGTKLTGLTRGVGSTSPGDHGKGVSVQFKDYTPTRTVAKVDAQPYELTWWEAPDCGGEIDQLAQETPFDYTESHDWGAGQTITHKLIVGYPRLGRKRDDLSFVQPDNISNVVAVSRDGDSFANEVTTLGKGEGPKTLRAEAAVRDGRLRRPYVWTDKLVNTTARLQTRARAELRVRTTDVVIAEVTVQDHPNAKLGSWHVGDDVLIQATVPWLGDVSLWSRITSWSLLSDSTATLSLARSDGFHYGITTVGA